MMEEIKPKKERKFLKAIGNIAKVLANELVMGIARKFIGKAIDKVGNKRQGLVIAFVLVTGISYASIDSIPYPVTGNKQRLGWQTSGNGLVYRGRSNDTITKPSSYVDKNVKAYLLLDSVRGTIFVWRQTYWDSILVGSGAFAQPIDSLFFDTSVPSNNVDTAKMRWDSELGTVILGMYDQVPNELGFKNFWLVKNQTGSTITKGSIVYANGTVGASGRITVAKFIANGSIDAKYLLGITAHDLTDGEDGYVISFGKIRQVNTDTFAAGAILYPSPTVAGVWTDVEPVAPNIDMPIGFCINSSSNNGTIAIRVASGYKLNELHDVSISSPVEKASLYYSGGLWRDTTAALLVSDTASMLTPYFRDADTSSLNLTSRFAAKQNTLTNPVTGTGTNNFLPKFTSTGSTIGNSTIQDNGTTVSTSSILSTTNYVALDAGNNTHRFTNTLSQNQTWIAPSGFITSFFNANTSGGWYFNDTLSNSGYPILSILSKSNDRKKTGITLNSQDTAINTYTPALTFSSLSNSGQYYSAYAAILGKKTGTGNSSFPDNLPDNNWNSGHLEFYGTTQATGSLGGIMRNPNMVLGNGVGIGYDAPPIVRGRLTVLEKLGINQSTPNFALDVSGTANITGATTLGSTLNVTGNVGINTTSTSGANLIIKNSQEPSRATVVATQTFAADTTNWTRGVGWTFNGTQAVATAATGELTYNPALTITSGNAYEITYTVTGYSAGTLTVALGNVSLALPTHNATANVILLSPTSATGGFRFTTSTFTGNVVNVSIVEITNVAPVIFAGQDDGAATLYNSLRMPNSTTFAIGGGGARTTGGSNNFIGLLSGNNNATGNSNNFFGNQSGQFNTSGSNNNFIGFFSGNLNTTGSNNNFMGSETGRRNTIGTNNNFYGNTAGAFNTTGSANNFFGGFSGLVNTTGSSNNFFGNQSGVNNTTGSANNFFGSSAGLNNISGNDNNFFGSASGVNNRDGIRNNFFGINAGASNRSGNNNIAIGSNALNNPTVGDTLTGSNNLAFGTNAADNIRFAASGNVAIGNNIDLSDPSGSNQVVIKNVYFATGASTTGTTIAAASKAGIKTNAPNRDLEVAGEVRITDLTTDTPTRLVGADADGDLGQVTLGSTLSLTGSSLGVTSNTFLPLTGGTLTGGLTGTTALFSGNVAIGFPFAYKPFEVLSNANDFVSVGVNTLGQFQWSGIHFGYREADVVYRKSAIVFQRNEAGPADASGKIHLLNVNSFEGSRNADLRDAKLTIGNNGFVGINDTTPSFTLDVNGTLGVTGATTLSAPLTVNSSAVFNEGSADADFRVESDANANMIFVDASTNRVGIGTNTPTKTLDVNGELNVGSAGTFGGRLNTNWLERTYSNSTATSLTVSVNTTWLKLVNNSTITLTLPNAETYPGKELHIKNAGTGAVNSLSSNIEPLNSTTVGTAILASGGGKWATLVSDGSNWVIMSGN